MVKHANGGGLDPVTAAKSALVHAHRHIEAIFPGAAITILVSPHGAGSAKPPMRVEFNHVTSAARDDLRAVLAGLLEEIGQ